MGRPRAAEGHEHEVTRVEALLGQNGVQRPDHVVVGDAQDRVGRRLDRQSEGRRYVADGATGSFGVESHVSAEKVAGIDPAEHDVGVRDGRQHPAASVAGGSRIGASALRSND